MSLLDLLLGRPLASDETRAEWCWPCCWDSDLRPGCPQLRGVRTRGCADAADSSRRGGHRQMVPISASIIVLLTIVYFSYRQTIQAYPGGGGSYTVARQNLGVSAGLLAAAALMIDYVLVVAVGISAGVGALVSAAPKLQPHTLALCLVCLVLIHSNQSPWRARNWPDLYGANISICWKPVRGNWDRPFQNIRGWWSSLAA